MCRNKESANENASVLCKVVILHVEIREARHGAQIGLLHRVQLVAGQLQGHKCVACEHAANVGHGAGQPRLLHDELGERRQPKDGLGKQAESAKPRWCGHAANEVNTKMSLHTLKNQSSRIPVQSSAK